MTATPFRPLTKSDVAEILGISMRTIENMVKSQRMPAPAHVGGRALWHPEIFYSWLDKELRQVESPEVPEAYGHETPENGALDMTSKDMAALGLWPASGSLTQQEPFEAASPGKTKKATRGSVPKLSAAERMKKRQAEQLVWDEVNG